MVCDDCRKAADSDPFEPVEHPEDCGCTCQHGPQGSWNGGKTE